MTMSPLEAALREVHATLAQLLVAADEQYAAVAAGDRLRIESVTRQQEQLSARLARAEAARQSVLGGEELTAAVKSSARTQELHDSIAVAVRELRHRNARTASLLEQTAALASQTLNFLQRLVTTPNPVYGAAKTSLAAPRHSLLVDSRA